MEITDESVDSLPSVQPSEAGSQAGRQNSHLLCSIRPAFSNGENESSAVVFKGLQKISLLDYPGKLAALIFVGGCNFRCPFCYNRDIVLNPESSPSLREEEILGYLKTRMEWLDGVVVTGGEPTIYPGMPSFLEKVKKLGYSIKLDTNGSNPKMLAELLEKNLVDYIALDVKAPLLEERYQEATGTQGCVLEEVKRSIALLRSSNGIDYEFRTTLVPKLLSEEDVILIAERIKGAKQYYLQQFKPTGSHVDESYSSVKPYPLEILQEIQRKIAHNFQICRVRGAATTNFRLKSPRGSNSLNITYGALSPPSRLKGKDEEQHGGG